jgi:predicted dehydrogenase
MFQIAVVGSGFMAKTWCMVADQTENAEAVAVFGGSRCADFASEYGLKAFDSLGAMLKSDDINVVIITSPPNAHYEQTIAAVSAGKHVLVEKPMAVDLNEAKQMTELAMKNGVTLGVVSQNRYRHSPKLAKKFVSDGMNELGDLKTILVKGQVERWWSGSTPNSWKSTVESFDPWTGWASHACDLVNWLVSDIPVDVFAVGSETYGLWETITTGIRYANGTLATLMLDQRGIWTSHGAELDSKQGQLSYTDDAVVKSPIRLNAYEAQLQNFLEAVAAARDPDVGISAGLMTQTVMEAVKNSVLSRSLVHLGD